MVAVVLMVHTLIGIVPQVVALLVLRIIGGTGTPMMTRREISLRQVAGRLLSFSAVMQVLARQAGPTVL